MGNFNLLYHHSYGNKLKVGDSRLVEFRMNLFYTPNYNFYILLLLYLKWSAWSPEICSTTISCIWASFYTRWTRCWPTSLITCSIFPSKKIFWNNKRGSTCPRNCYYYLLCTWIIMSTIIWTFNQSCRWITTNIIYNKIIIINLFFICYFYLILYIIYLIGESVIRKM